MYLAQKRWPELEDLACRLECRPEGKLKAALLRGRATLARQEFASAKALFTELAREFPEVLEPHLLLSYAYLQEGKDWDAAEAALHAVLALDPSHQEARHNLDVLCRQQRLGQN